MKFKSMLPASHWFSAPAAGAFLSLFGCLRTAGAAPFGVEGPGVDASHFRVTTFAAGLDFPLGMATLSDGSLLVAISEGSNFFLTKGKLVRFVDANQDGVADGPGVVLYDNLPGSLTDLRVVGNLVFVTGQAKPIVVLRAGATPADPLTLVGRIGIDYPPSWEHPNSALAIRAKPGRTNEYDLLFQLGSDANFAVTTRTATLTNDNIPGATGVLPGDSILGLTLTDLGTNVTAANVTQLASGVRNPAGLAFHPTTGDLYFEDNGIDGLVDGNEPLSADELNRIPRANLGVSVANFGFPGSYTTYRTGATVGTAGIPPLMVFQPLPDPFTGHESEGPNDIVFAPPGFPEGLNTGVFLGFHGRFGEGGANNEENPVVYANPSTGNYFHFIAGQQPGIGHFDGLLATRDSLFLADLASTGNIFNGAGTGVIYQIQSLVKPPAPILGVRRVETRLELSWDRGVLQEAGEIAGPWSDVPDAFSPHLVPATGPGKFYRARY